MNVYILISITLYLNTCIIFIDYYLINIECIINNYSIAVISIQIYLISIKFLSIYI